MKSLKTQLKAARAEVNKHEFGTAEWESEMVVVRELCDAIDAASTPEEFCSVDSGVHRTRLLNGVIV